MIKLFQIIFVISMIFYTFKLIIQNEIKYPTL